MERQLGLRAMVEVGEGAHRRNVDTEEHHDDEERSIRAQLEKLEEEIASYHSEVASSGTASGLEHCAARTGSCSNFELLGFRLAKGVLGRLGVLTRPTMCSGLFPGCWT